MNDLEAGTFVMMVKNNDGSFSPVGLSKEQAYIIRTFLSKLSEDSPFIIKSEDRQCTNYVITNRKPLIQPFLSSTTRQRKRTPSWCYPRGQERALS